MEYIPSNAKNFPLPFIYFLWNCKPYPYAGNSKVHKSLERLHHHRKCHNSFRLATKRYDGVVFPWWNTQVFVLVDGRKTWDWFKSVGKYIFSSKKKPSGKFPCRLKLSNLRKEIFVLSQKIKGIQQFCELIPIIYKYILFISKLIPATRFSTLKLIPYQFILASPDRSSITLSLI